MPDRLALKRIMTVMRRDLPSGTLTFLFTDVEGSTKLLHELGAEAYAEALAEHRRILRKAFRSYGGVEVDTQGDGFFIVFPTAPGALRAAAEALIGLASGVLPVRIGVHTGTAHLGEEGYVGIDVHRAARIAAAGHGGQVLVSAATAALLGPHGLRDLGEHRLKDLSAPERIYQLGDAAFPPLHSLHQTNLPIPSTPFLGREQELAEVLELLSREDTRLLTLTGPGGTGKTRLALQAAGRSSDSFPDGVWWVPLSPLRDPKLVLETAGQVLGAEGGLDEHVAGRSMLMLFDNFEQVVAAAGDIAGLLAACPNLRVLATSRAPLHIGAEREYTVAPMRAHEAEELFAGRARAADHSFIRDDVVAQICRRLDGLPLAIELAAARVKVLSTAGILRNLDRRLPMLTGGPRDAPARHQTLRATIAWSCDLLEPAELALFRRMAVFSGGCTLEAAISICQEGLEEVTALVDHSLVRRLDDRLVMLETIREFADGLLTASGEEASVRARHARFFRELVVESSLPNGDNPSFGLMTDETDNLRAAMTYLTEQPTTDDALDMALALGRTWYAQGRLVEADEWFTRALARSDPTETERRQWALSLSSEFPRFLGEWSRAEDRKLQALAIARRLELPRKVAAELAALGSIAALRGDLRLARERHEEGLAIRRSLGEPLGLAHALTEFADLELLEGSPASAAKHFEESVALVRSEGQSELETGQLGVNGLLRLAEARRQLGDFDRAGELFSEGLQLARVVGLVGNARHGLEGTAGVFVAHGWADRAAVLIGAAARSLRETGFVDDSAVERAPTETAAGLTLGEETYRARWLEGSALSVPEAIDYALIGLGEATAAPNRHR